MKAGLVSAIVPTRDSARTIRACLESIRAQSYPSIEVVVVDNHSSDGTKRLAGQTADAVLAGGSERSSQRNAGAAAASGEFLLFVDSDMVLERDVVAQCVAEAGAGAAAVVIRETSFGEGFWAAVKALERSCYVGDETVEAARFYRRETFAAVGGYEEAYLGPEDWDLHARVAGSGAQVGRTSAWIHHDEGRLCIHRLMAKKFLYGRSIALYARRHPQLARRQLVPVRRAFLRHRRRLAAQPALLGGLVVMKSCEMVAGAAGALRGVFDAR